MSPTKEDARNSFLWSFFEKWLARFTQLVVFVLLGRLLAPADFGLVALATAYITLANIFVDSGFGKALVQKKHLTPRDVSTGFAVAAIIGISLCATTWALSPVVADAFGEPALAPLLTVMSVVILLQSLSAVPAALLEREMRFKALAIRRTASAAVGGAVAVGMAFAGYGVWSLAAQVVITGLMSTVLVWVAYRSWPGLRVDAASFASLRRTGFSVVGIEFIGFANAQADKLIIGVFLGAEALGYYFLAMRVVSITVELFTAVFSSVSLTIFSRIQSDPDMVRRWLGKLTTGTSLLTVPVFCFYGIFSTEVIRVAFGPQWGESSSLFQILVFLGIINSMLIFDRNVLIALGRSLSALYLTAGQALLGVVLLLVAAPHGIVYVAVAVVVRQYAFWPVRLAVLRRVVHIEIYAYIRDWLICFALTLTVMVLAWLVEQRDLTAEATVALKLTVFVTVFGVVYSLVFRPVLGEMTRLVLKRTGGR